MAEEGRPLPNFEKPPVIETALGVEFHPLNGWTGIHAGLYWAELRGDYPFSEEQPPLGSQIERFGQAESARPPFDILPFSTQRYWFIDQERLRLLQLQNNRLLVNWRKTKDTDAYPRYPSCREHFQREWVRFRAHLKRQGMPEPQALQCEVTYVNHFIKGEEWSSVSDLPKILSPWSGVSSGAFLPSPDAVAMNLRFAMPDQSGRLHVSVDHARRLSDAKEIIQMTLTARGAPASSSDEDIGRWLDFGREWVVRGFTDLTSAEMHSRWRRKA